MIVNELKPLLGDNWKSKFKHRDLWDPDGYGVASFDLGGERPTVLAINFETEDIMEYFYDDRPDDEWISMDRLFRCLYSSKLPNLKKYYTIYINKKGEIKSEQKVVPLSLYTKSKNNKYPTKGFYTKSDSEEVGISLRIHRLVAFIFVPNLDPTKYNIVNHIDTNVKNFHRENLEWCDIKTNNQIEKRKAAKKSVYYISTDPISGKEEILRGIKYRKDAKNIRKAAELGVVYGGKTWKRVDEVLSNYLENHPIKEDKWYNNKFITSHKVEANECGVLRVNGKITVGGLRSDKLYYEIRLAGITYKTHRIVYETISGKQIPKGYVIDHIVPVEPENINNEFSNLRLVTPSENMLNPTTVSKIRNVTKRLDLFGNEVRKFESAKAAGEELGIRRSHIDEASRGELLLVDGAIWVREGEESTIPNKLAYIYYKIDKNGVPIDANVNLGNIFSKLSYTTTSKYLNTGMPAPDGYYYQQGDPFNLLKDDNNIELAKKRERVFFHKKANQSRLSPTTLRI